MKRALAALIALLCLLISGCSKTEAPEISASPEMSDKEETSMKLFINDTEVPVTWEKNDAVTTLRGLARDGLTISMSMYGGFEQVGSIGQTLPRSDSQTKETSFSIPAVRSWCSTAPTRGPTPVWGTWICPARR